MADRAQTSADLFGGAAPPAVPIAPEAGALAALALAFAHMDVASYPHRQPPGDAFLARYAETKGAHEAEQMLRALRRLSPAHRRAIAAELASVGRSTSTVPKEGTP